MGIVQNIRGYCFEEEQGKEESSLSKANLLMNQDYSYFQQQKWYRFQEKTYFDPNKFIFLYNNYKNTQKQLLDLWKIVNTKRAWNTGEKYSEEKIMSEKWKYAIRKGVPTIYYKSMIETIFNKRITPINLQKTYQSLHAQITINSVQKMEGDRVPNAPFLNTAGQEAIKRIKNLLQSNFGELKYNPYLPDVIALMLIFLEEEKVYEILNFMMETSLQMTEQREKSLHWYFVFTQYQMQKFSAEFYKKIKMISPTIAVINEHFNTEGINKVEIFKEIVGNFFYGFLPFPIILKIFLIYLNQGVKCFYRIFYAILKVVGHAIRDANNTKGVLRVIKKRILVELEKKEEVIRFFRLAFDLRLIQSYNLEKIQTSTRNKTNIGGSHYYLPIITGDSQILSFEDLEVMWDYLPKQLQHYNMRKAFPCQNGVVNLKSLKETIEDHNFVFILIEALNKSVFGVFLYDKLKPQDRKFLVQKKVSMMINDNEDEGEKKPKQEYILKYTGSSANFVFTLYPEKAHYPSTGLNVFYCLMDENMFGVGGPANKPALQLDFDLFSGLSFQSPTYNNRPLHGSIPGEFRINKIQCFFVQ